MRTRRTLLALISVSAFILTPLSACGSASSPSSEGSVYYLSSKAEIVTQLKELASTYTQQTGVEVTVNTAASGTNDQTLVSELAKSDGPTMFDIAGFDQFARFKRYLEPLENSQPYKLLTDEGKSYSFTDDTAAYSIPFAAEWYGIIYNKKIVNTYIQKNYSVISSADAITNYATLKEVALSMQKHKDDLGISGAFSTPGLDSSNDYRYVGHMIRIPLFYEMRDQNVHFSTKLKGTYLPNYKNLWDLEINNSPTPRSMLSSKSYDDSTNEFAQGKVAFYPNGTWAYTQIKGNKVADSDIGMLPYYMGIKGEDSYGPASIYDANWAINKNASAENKKATLKFIEWLISSKKGRESISKKMNLSAPFTTFTKEYQPNNPLVDLAKAYSAEGKKTPYSVSVPGIQWHNDLTMALLEYTQGTGKWAVFKNAFTKKWTAEWKNNKEASGVIPPTGTFED